MGHYFCTDSHEGTTVQIGERSSHTMIRIYDKAAQLGVQEDGHWIRVEIQFRKENAASFVKRYLKKENCLHEVFLGTLHKYLRYADPTNDTNKSRWPTKKYWEKFLQAAEKVKIYEKPGVEYNLGKLERYIYQALPSIKTYIEQQGLLNLIDLVQMTDNSNPKYQALKQMYGTWATSKGLDDEKALEDMRDRIVDYIMELFKSEEKTPSLPQEDMQGLRESMRMKEEAYYLNLDEKRKTGQWKETVRKIYEKEYGNNG
jgi:hypothetical protein